MSIIIAKIEKDECLFRSDTKVSIENGDDSVTGNNRIRLAPEEGVLKIHILNESLCVAFAGNVKICCEIINGIFYKKSNDGKSIIQFIKDKLELLNDDSEFIVAYVKKHFEPRLFKIDKNKVEEGKSFWIGNHEAFNEFQSYFLDNKPSFSSLDKTVYAFREMIRNSKINSIGDFVIGAYYNKTNTSFLYEEAMESNSGYAVTIVEENVKTTISEGTTEEGAFTVSNIVSNRINKPAICLYFQKGNLGYLYFPISKDNLEARPYVIQNVSLIELKRKVLEKFKIELIGFSMNLGHFNITK